MMDSMSDRASVIERLVLWLMRSLTVLCDAGSQAGPVPPIRRRHTPHICSSREERIGEREVGRSDDVRHAGVMGWAG